MCAAIPNPWQMPRALRWVFVVLGLSCVGVGGVGVFVPGLPTTVFLILASYFFTRSCPPLDRWMRSARLFKPYARYLDRRTPMPTHAVVLTISIIWIAIAFSSVRLWTVFAPFVVVSLAAFLGGLASFSVVWWGRISILRELVAEKARVQP